MPTAEANSIWKSPAGGSLVAAMLGLRPMSGDDRATLAKLTARRLAQDGDFNEADHPRASNGQFGSGSGSAGANPYVEGAAAIKAMDPEKRDDTYPGDLPGGWSAYILYEAQKLAPKPSEKIKRVTDNNSFALHQDMHAIANVDGQLFGLSKYEDPDAESDEEDRNGDPKEYCWHFVRLDHPNEKGVDTHTRDPEELFKAMRAYQAPAEVFVPGAKKLAQDAGQWNENDHPRAGNGQFGAGGSKETAAKSAPASLGRTFIPADLYTEAERAIALYSKEEPAGEPLTEAEKTKAAGELAQHLEAAHAAKPAYDATLKSIGEKLGAEVKLAGIKGGDRLLEKHVKENDSLAHKMKDLVRGSLVVKSLADVGPALEAIQKNFKIARTLDRFAKPLDTGYSDILINVELPGGILGEVQIHVPEMLAAKNELGHAVYNIERKLAPSPLKTQLVELQSRVYGAARKAADQRVSKGE